MWHDLFIVERVHGLAVFCCRSLLWRVSLWFVPVMKFGFSSLWVSLGCDQSFHMWITTSRLDVWLASVWRVSGVSLDPPLSVVCGVLLGEDGFRRLLLKSTREDDECHFPGLTPSTRDRRFPRACLSVAIWAQMVQVHLLPWRIAALD